MGDASNTQVGLACFYSKLCTVIKTERTTNALKPVKLCILFKKEEGQRQKHIFPTLMIENFVCLRILIASGGAICGMPCAQDSDHQDFQWHWCLLKLEIPNKVERSILFRADLQSNMKYEFDN